MQYHNDNPDFRSNSTPALSIRSGFLSLVILSLLLVGIRLQLEEPSIQVRISFASKISKLKFFADTDVVFSIGDSSELPEGTGCPNAFIFRVSRSVNFPTSDVLQTSVDYTVTGSGANPANAMDFQGDTFPHGTIVFPAMNDTFTRILRIPVKPDIDLEPDEEFTVTLSNAVGLGSGNLLDPNALSADGLIYNDDAFMCPRDTTVECASLVPPVDTSTVTGADGLYIIHLKDSVPIADSVCINQKVIYRTYQGTDTCMGTLVLQCTQIITVLDTVAPFFPVIPNNIDTVQCGQIFDIVFPGSPARDTCDGSIFVDTDISIIDSTCPGNLKILIVYTVSDVCGNSRERRDTIVKIDTIPPTISCPGGDTIDLECGIPIPEAYTNLDSFIINGGGLVRDSCCIDSASFSVSPDVMIVVKGILG